MKNNYKIILVLPILISAVAVFGVIFMPQSAGAEPISNDLAAHYFDLAEEAADDETRGYFEWCFDTYWYVDWECYESAELYYDHMHRYIAHELAYFDGVIAENHILRPSYAHYQPTSGGGSGC